MIEVLFPSDSPNTKPFYIMYLSNRKIYTVHDTKKYAETIAVSTAAIYKWVNNNSERHNIVYGRTIDDINSWNPPEDALFEPIRLFNLNTKDRITLYTPQQIHDWIVENGYDGDDFIKSYKDWQADSDEIDKFGADTGWIFTDKA